MGEGGGDGEGRLVGDKCYFFGGFNAQAGGYGGVGAWGELGWEGLGQERLLALAGRSICDVRRGGATYFCLAW